MAQKVLRALSGITGKAFVAAPWCWVLTGAWLSKSMPVSGFAAHSSSDHRELLFDINGRDAESIIIRMHFHSHCTAKRERGDSLISSQFSLEVVWIALELPVSSSCLSQSLRWLLPRPDTLHAAWMDGICLEEESLGKYFLTALFLSKWLFPLETADLFHYIWERTDCISVFCRKPVFHFNYCNTV